MLKKIIHNLKYEPQKRMNAILSLVALAVATYAVLFVMVITGINSKVISSHMAEQDKYCRQLAISLDSMITEETDNEELVEYIRKNVEIEGNIWPFLIVDNEVVFAKDKATTDNLRKFTDKKLFLDNLRAQNQIMSLVTFPNNTNYEIGIIADRNKYIDSSGMSTYGMFTIILFASIVIFSVAGIVYVTGFWTKADKKLLDIQEKLRVRNEEFEIYKNKNEEYYSTNALMPESHGRSNRYKQYAFKFYINARHAIYIDGKLGAMHPHTWEIHLNVIKVSNDFVQFNEVERAIEELIAPFQDKEINSIEPFNVVNPTLENCCNYFRDEIANILKDKGWLLLMIEMSETPSRSYVVNMIADDT